MNTLATVLPPPVSAAERQFLRDRLLVFALAAGRHLHRGFHTRVPRARCVGLDLDDRLDVWFEAAGRDTHACDLLMRWTRAHLEGFDTTHRWPPAHRAAEILKRTLASPPTVAAVAGMVGCSRRC